jgi:hypothetical protein
MSTEREKAYMRSYMRRRMHGPFVDEWSAAAWQRQEGRCYLCGDPMDIDKAVIDHDHDCCPKNSSCSNCRRGLAHYACNFLVGEAKDSPERLRKIADNLEKAKLEALTKIGQGSGGGVLW